MKVAVVNNGVPFVKGGAEYLADSLTRKLEEFGHQAILVRIPFAWEPPNKIVESMLACRLLRIPNVDRVIALKFPAYYIPHPEKVLWLLHQFRQAYDLWGTPFQGLPNSPEGLAIREAIIKTDNTYLTQVRKIYTNSEVTSKRLMTFNGIDSTVLYPPLLETTHFTCDGYGDYVYFPSRITQSKRQHLAVESMRYVRSNTRLIVSGKEEAPEDLVRIEKLIKDHRLAARVTIINRFISEKEKSDLFSKALGCVYIPYDEDSYGYVTLESYHARKPVITCDDSGGTSLVVKDGMTGFIVPPQAEALADAIDRLAADRRKAQIMGEAGYDLVGQLRISWDHVIANLTA